MKNSFHLISMGLRLVSERLWNLTMTGKTQHNAVISDHYKNGERGRNRTFNLVIKSQHRQAYAVDFTFAHDGLGRRIAGY
jgi:hypothetical protein